MNPDAGLVLAPEWRRWIKANLGRGGSDDAIIARLLKEGVSREMGEGAIRSCRAEAEAEAVNRDHRSHQEVLRLRRALRRQYGASLKIPERSEVDEEEFFREFYAENRPLLVRDFAANSAAVRRWCPAYLRERVGAVEVTITDGRDSEPDYDRNQDELRRKITMAELVDRVEGTEESNDFYMVARDHAFRKDGMEVLLEDLPDHHGLLHAESIASTLALWFGPRGTVTPLHYDTSNILFIQVYGSKTVHLAAPDESALWSGHRSIYSDEDPERPSPAAQDVTYLKTTLHAGDMLFIPVGWWHHLRAESTSISLACNGFPKNNRFDWYKPGGP